MSDGPSYSLTSALPFDLPFDPAASPLAERTAWCIERMTRGDLTEAIVTSHCATSEVRTAATLLATFTTFADRLGSVTNYEEVSPTFSRCDAVDNKGQPRVLQCRVTETAPHLVRTMMAFHAPPPGVEVRPATSADADALRELERRTPVTDDGVTVTYDRGTDYLAATRMMEDVSVLIAELDGVAVGEHCDAFRRAIVGGREWLIALRHHTRVDPAHQGRKIWPALNAAAGDAFYGKGTDPAEETITRVGNARMRELRANASGAVNQWSTEVELCSIDCVAAGRSAQPAFVATEADAPTIVELCNSAHGDEQIYRPYTAESLTERLTRAPDLYSWGDMLLNEQAAVGVWDQRLHIRYGDGREQVRAIVLDSGFRRDVPSGDFEALLRSWCALLAASGTTHLAVFTSTRSPGRELLHSMAETVERFLHTCRLSEPQPPVGVYFDAVYA